jgi:chromosome segregation ATPase
MESRTDIERREARVNEYKARIELLRAQAQRITAEAKAEYVEILEDLNAKRQAIEFRLTKLAGSGEGAWSELREGIESAIDELADALDRASNQFGDQARSQTNAKDDVEKGTKMSERTDYQEKVERRIEEIGTRIDKLQAKAEAAKADLKAQYLEAVDELQAKQSEAKEKADELTAAGEEAWSELRGGVDAAISELADALDKATERFSAQD